MAAWYWDRSFATDCRHHSRDASRRLRVRGREFPLLSDAAFQWALSEQSFSDFCSGARSNSKRSIPARAKQLLRDHFFCIRSNLLLGRLPRIPIRRWRCFNANYFFNLHFCGNCQKRAILNSCCYCLKPLAVDGRRPVHTFAEADFFLDLIL